MKATDLKKRLIMETVIYASILGVMGAIALSLDTMSTSYDSQAQSLQSQSNQVTNEMMQLREKYDKVQKNSQLYEEMQKKSANDGLVINRDAVRAKFDDYKARFFLNNVHLTMQAVQDVSLPGAVAGAKPKSTMQQSEVSVTFDALNDEDVFGLLQAVESEFSGATKVTKFSIKRANKVTDSVLNEITKSGQAAMVQGELKFVWYGLKPQEVAPNTPAGANAPAPKP